MKRDKNIDTAKVMGVFLVVFAHLYATYSTERLYIYSFHMPFFFIISGLVHNYKCKIQTTKYIKKILYPCVIYFFLFSIIYIPMTYYGILKAPIIYDYVVKSYAPNLNPTIFTWTGGYLQYNLFALVMGTDNSNVVLWFLFALFYCKISTDILKKYRSAIIPLLIMFIVTVLYRKSYFYIGQGLMALPFYLIGYFTKKQYQNFTNKKRKYLTALGGILCLGINVVLTQINGRVSMSGLMFGENGFLPLQIATFYINGILGAISLILFAFFLQRLKIRYIAKSLITILGLQMIFVKLIVQNVGNDLPYVLSFVFSAFIIFILHILHQRLIKNILI